jgi:hypothetical protein
MILVLFLKRSGKDNTEDLCPKSPFWNIQWGFVLSAEGRLLRSWRLCSVQAFHIIIRSSVHLYLLTSDEFSETSSVERHQK